MGEKTLKVKLFTLSVEKELVLLKLVSVYYK